LKAHALCDSDLLFSKGLVLTLNRSGIPLVELKYSPIDEKENIAIVENKNIEVLLNFSLFLNGDSTNLYEIQAKTNVIAIANKISIVDGRLTE
tara:strand:- start:85 stop:363 length:279 start_codon:yes stop_codon:yes gene_type:complete